MEHWNNLQNDDFLDFQKTPVNQIVASQPSYPDMDNLHQLKLGFAKMMSTMERLEQRLDRVEQTTSQILKNQQETLQAPFMSQSELDKARKVAEQLEQDTKVAKQLQESYNKEVEANMKKPQTPQPKVMNSECPICGTRVNQMDLEVHVDNCLELYSNDPRKSHEVVDTKKKIENGFFSKLLKRTTSKTETKIITEEATAPLLSHSSYSHDNDGVMNSGYYPPFNYPQFPQNGQISNQPVMMPLYMYPSYPSINSNH